MQSVVRISQLILQKMFGELIVKFKGPQRYREPDSRNELEMERYIERETRTVRQTDRNRQIETDR